MGTATSLTTLNLSKDQKVDLTKTNPGLTKVSIGLGWDLQDGKTFDLDSFVFLLKDGKLLDADAKKCVCYFGNKNINGVHHHGDNLTGAGDGDDETIDVTFASLPADCTEVIIGVNIYNQPNSNFGMVKNAFARIYDATDASKTSILKYDLSEDKGTTNAVIFGRLYKHTAEGETTAQWKFQALGEPKSGDINQLAAAYQ